MSPKSIEKIPERWCEHCKALRGGPFCPVCKNATSLLATVGQQAEMHDHLFCPTCREPLAGARLYNESAHGITLRIHAAKTPEGIRIVVGASDTKPVVDVTGFDLLGLSRKDH